jgi:hypothetical protein
VSGINCIGLNKAQKARLNCGRGPLTLFKLTLLTKLKISRSILFQKEDIYYACMLLYIY